MFNHSRGLWGYTGDAPDGRPLTVQATGMGGPSAAIVAEELITLGARRLLRIGTCGALSDELALGDLVAAETVIPADGASSALGAKGELSADPTMTAALAGAGALPAKVVSSDLFFDPRSDAGRPWEGRGAVAVEMEAAAILQVAALRGAAAACLLAVTDAPAPSRARGKGVHRMQPPELEAVGLRLGEVGYRALG